VGLQPHESWPMEGRASAPGLSLMNAVNRKGPRIGVPGELARWGEDGWPGAPREPLPRPLPTLSS
jgi:hypothetical protein